MSNEDDFKPCLPGPDESDACRKLLNVHGEYDFPDADLVLSSNDGQRFRVHSCVMRLASRVFKDMLDMPSPAGLPKDIGVARLVPLQERGEVVKLLLDLVYPDRSFLEPEKLSFDLFRDLCIAADKYDMPGAQHILRMTFQLGVNCYPLIAGYVLASQLDWEKERQLFSFSNKTLGINLRSPESREQLRAINSLAVWDLIELHDRRRDLLVEALDLGKWPRPEGSFTVNWERIRTHTDYRRGCCGTVSTCTQCPSWTALIYRLSEKMENISLATSLRDSGFWDREEFKLIWELTCCGSTKLISKEGLKNEVLRILDNLPKTV